MLKNHEFKIGGIVASLEGSGVFQQEIKFFGIVIKNECGAIDVCWLPDAAHKSLRLIKGINFINLQVNHGFEYKLF